MSSVRGDSSARDDSGARGACVWFTGLSGSGKSTTAEALVPLLEARGRTVTMLDGDVVRTHLTAGLGFSKADRDTNVRRVGWVAAEIVRHGGLVVAALVSPYRETRDEVRAMVGPEFVEVFVDTPLDVVEQRDVKGWYAKARAGEVPEFTGVSDPYEPPLEPELTLTTTDTTPEANAQLVLEYLESRGILAP
jgi:sulfate adenylyltransferase